ncbi:3-oxoacyl-ACP synthase [Micromonospora sp. MP36]|nr:3-oxoacyl-ACP synthase [Micromonospora sp. MP36]
MVSGWSAVSPYGLGARAFADGLATGEEPVTKLDAGTWPGPYERAGIVPDFDIPTVLGAKGTRSMDRITGLAVTAVRELFEEHGPELAERPEDVGLVLGTGSGSVQSIMDFTRDSLVGAKPFDVDPARFPNTVMNCAAGQSAIRYRLKGPNTTISGGALTGLLALNYAARLHRRGRVDVMLCGAVEEYSVQRAWLEWHAGGREGASGPLGEGCALLLLESPASAARYGRPALAAVRGARFRAFDRPSEAREALATAIAQLLVDTGTDGGDVALVATSGTPGPLGVAERAAVRQLVGSGPSQVDSRRQIGDTASASAAFQLAAVLASAGPPELAGRHALVTAVDAEGTAGCALLRLGPGLAMPDPRSDVTRTDGVGRPEPSASEANAYSRANQTKKG